MCDARERRVGNHVPSPKSVARPIRTETLDPSRAAGDGPSMRPTSHSSARPTGTVTILASAPISDPPARRRCPRSRSRRSILWRHRRARSASTRTRDCAIGTPTSHRVGMSTPSHPDMPESRHEGTPAHGPAGPSPRRAARGPKRRHLPALPYEEVAECIANVRSSARASESSKLALEFLVLTAARSGEVRKATLEEIDLDGATWTVPSESSAASASTSSARLGQANRRVVSDAVVGAPALDGEALIPRLRAPRGDAQIKPVLVDEPRRTLSSFDLAYCQLAHSRTTNRNPIDTSLPDSGWSVKEPSDIDKRLFISRICILEGREDVSRKVAVTDSLSANPRTVNHSFTGFSPNPSSQ